MQILNRCTKYMVELIQVIQDKHFNNNDHREYTKEETLTTTDNDEKRQTNEQNMKSFYTEN